MVRGRGCVQQPQGSFSKMTDGQTQREERQKEGGQVRLRERALGLDSEPLAMVIMWTVTDTIASPQELTEARLSPPGGKRERERSDIIFMP